MEKSWETDNCAAVKAHYAIYSIPEAAALWCGVPEKEMLQILEEAKPICPTGLGRNIWSHPAVPCLEPRSRAIAEAIDKGELPHGREDAEPVCDYVAHERRHFFGRDLKKWMEKAFPNDKPAFLFDDIERSAHTAISPDAFRALKAEHDKLAVRLKNAKSECIKLREENDKLERANQSLEAISEKANTPGERAESTYLKIIGAMLDLMLGKSPGGQPYCKLTSQADIITVMVACHDSKPGISQRTLEEKFAAAKRELTVS